MALCNFPGRGAWAVVALMLWCGLASPASALTVTSSADAVQASDDDGQIIWRHDYRIASVSPDQAQHLHGLVEIGDIVVYGVGTSLYEVDRTSGKVLDRHYLPGKIVGLERDGDLIQMTVGASKTGSPSWSRTYRVDPASRGTERAGERSLPFALTTEAAGLFLLRRQPESVIDPEVAPNPRRLSPEERQAAWRAPELKEPLEAAVAELERLAARDRTNP